MAQFRHRNYGFDIKQAEAVLKVIQRKENILAILATGSGKTILYMLPSLLETNCMTLGASASIMDYAQESGRGGRDGQGAKALIVTSEEYLKEGREKGVNTKQNYTI